MTHTCTKPAGNRCCHQMNDVSVSNKLLILYDGWNLVTPTQSEPEVDLLKIKDKTIKHPHNTISKPRLSNSTFCNPTVFLCESIYLHKLWVCWHLTHTNNLECVVVYIWNTVTASLFADLHHHTATDPPHPLWACKVVAYNISSRANSKLVGNEAWITYSLRAVSSEVITSHLPVLQQKVTADATEFIRFHCENDGMIMNNRILQFHQHSALL